MDGLANPASCMFNIVLYGEISPQGKMFNIESMTAE